MDATRTHEVAHQQSIRTWFVIGAVGLALAVAVTVGVGMNGDGVVVKAPARTVVDAERARGSGQPLGASRSPKSERPPSTCRVPARAVTGIRQGHAHPGAIPNRLHRRARERRLIRSAGQDSDSTSRLVVGMAADQAPDGTTVDRRMRSSVPSRMWAGSTG